MNVTIRIGDEQRSIGDNYEAWISEQIRNRRKSGQKARIVIEIGGDLALTFACEDSPTGGGGGGSRNYSLRQQGIIDLWFKHGLDKCPINPGEVISFLKQLRKLI